MFFRKVGADDVQMDYIAGTGCKCHHTIQLLTDRLGVGLKREGIAAAVDHIHLIDIIIRRQYRFRAIGQNQRIEDIDCLCTAGKFYLIGLFMEDIQRQRTGQRISH